MTLREAGVGDLPAVMAWLDARRTGPIFLAANLHDYGLNATARNAMKLWISDGLLDGVVGLTNGGMLLTDSPGADWPSLRPLLAGRDSVGAIGPQTEVGAALPALGLAEATCRLNAAENFYALDLTDLVSPDTGDCRLETPDASHFTLLRNWRVGALTETQGADADTAKDLATRDVTDWLAAGQHRLLLHNGTPVALCGLNARLPDRVQIGAVYTPPEFRNRGHARRCVALYLHELRQAGIRQALLFTGNPAAENAYSALGFRHVGQMSFVLFQNPERITSCL